MATFGVAKGRRADADPAGGGITIPPTPRDGSGSQRQVEETQVKDDAGLPASINFSKWNSWPTRTRCILCVVLFVLLAVVLGVVIFVLIWFQSSATLAITKNGGIQGQLVTAPGGSEVEEYLGIPFALPPVGERRYADPVPIEKFNQDPYPAKSYTKTCHQFLDLTFGDFQGSDMWNAKTGLDEDCLSLNVWAPKRVFKHQKKLPVMVWIFGGGFYSGSSSLWLYDGKALAGHGDVVVASMNYRVGSFGFLSTGDSRIKGNFGLKDQWLALKWIKENIASFGGDPDSITLFGESAGAASVGYHLLSTYSQPLFHRAILHSASPDSHWSYMNAQTARSRSAKFFADVGCPDDDNILQCLRSQSAEDLLNNEWVDSNFLVFPWVPTVDNDFVTDSPHSLIYSGQLPKDKEVLLGVNKDEGTFWISYTFEFLSKDHESLTSSQQYLDAIDVIDWDLDDQQRIEIKTKYKAVNPLDGAQNRDALDDVCGDRTFICPVYELGKVFAKSNVATYFYQLTYIASNEVWPPWMGVIHGADIQWVFGMPLDKSRGYTDHLASGCDKNEPELARKMMSYWVNFAKTGNPNGKYLSHGGIPRDLPDWPKHDADIGKYLRFGGSADRDITVEETTIRRQDTCQMWRKFNVEQQSTSGGIGKKGK